MYGQASHGDKQTVVGRGGMFRPVALFHLNPPQVLVAPKAAFVGAACLRPAVEGRAFSSLELHDRPPSDRP